MTRRAMTTGLLRRVAEESRSGRSLREQAKRLGLKLSRYYGVRNEARKRGLDVAYAPTGGEEGRTPADRKLAAAGRCACGLLKPCRSCVPTVDEVAGRRLAS